MKPALPLASSTSTDARRRPTSSSLVQAHSCPSMRPEQSEQHQKCPKAPSQPAPADYSKENSMKKLNPISSLSFIGTLIYASVIYHRHRRGTPYHRSRPKSPPSFHSSSPSFIPLATEYPSPSTDYTSKPPYNRASTAAPEKDERMMSHNNNNDDQKIGELDYRDTEIRELHSPEEEEVVMGYEEEKWRELQGDERVFEMRADRSVKGSRRATGVDGEAETR
ncbi:MAG: hypothetical protein LQ339_003180 [Xanthoria mediterranea]|nr:MAG: hypothetical protein LQ339_003180 [Xanthoria mediterranea]